ncbi:MAG: hypothetical protein IJU18_02805 [Oscillospiraceae bacterium]|nr:hypothetical protein [Oscillospiraceae bacterium]
MGLDFENYWACQENSTPVLQYFTDDPMDLTGVAQKVDYGWYDDTASELVIRDLPQLYAFMLLSYSTEYEQKTVKLDKDFSLNEGRAEDWIETPPENFWMPLPWFAGTLDGQGHTLSGVYVKGESVLGLCAHTRATATVKNLRLENTLIHATGDKDNMALTGAITGRGGGTFDTIYTDAIVYAAGQESGGLIGQINLNNVITTVTNCWFDGKVWAVGEKNGFFVGGMVGGHALGTLNMTHSLFSGVIHTEVDKGSRAGGFVGWSMNDAVTNIGDCLNAGTMDTLNHNWVGGAIGTVGAGPTIGINKSFAVRECMDGPSGDFVSHVTTAEEYKITGGLIPVYRENLIGRNACLWTNLDFDKYWSVRADGTPIPTVFYEGEPISTEGYEPIFSFDWYDAEAGGGTIYDRADFIGFTMLSWTTNFKGQTIRMGADVTVNSGNASDWANSAPALRLVPATYFAGTFDGQFHTLSGVYQRDQVLLGLFARTEKEAVIRNLRLVNSFYDVTGFGKFHVGYSGSIAGYFGGVLENIYSSAIIRTNGIMCGGVVGRANQKETNLFSSVWFDGELNAPDEEYGYYVGGILGVAHAGTNRMEHCLFTGTINTAVSNKGSKVGGLVGTVENTDTAVIIKDSLSAGTLHCGNPYYLGALIGTTYTGCPINISNTFADSASAIGGSGQFVALATHAAVKPGEVKGTAVPMSAEKLAGLNGYLWTTLDFDNYWAPRQNACPGLKPFVSSPLSVGSAKRKVDVSWYDPSASTMTLDSAEDLNGWQLLAYGDDFAGKTLVLGADIAVNSGNASDWGSKAPENVWTPVSSFAGTLDGRGHTVSGLYADSGSSAGSGLIGMLQGGTVKNLRLENSYVTGSGGDVGSVVGVIRNGGTLDTVYSDAIVATADGYNIGGLLGAVRNVGSDAAAYVRNSWFAGKVESGEGRNVGGLVGCPVNDESVLNIDNCLMSGSVHTDALRRVGGVICHAWNASHANISNTLVSGSVTTGGGGQTGSVLGSASDHVTLSNVYALQNSAVAAIGVGSASGKVQVMEKSLISGAEAYQFTALDFTAKPYWGAVADSTPVLKSLYSGATMDLSAVVKPDSSWFDENADTLTISTAADMIAFAVAGKQSDFAGKTVVLDADIDLNPGWTAGSGAADVEWPTMSQPFRGTFDGAGHTVRGLYADRISASVGLFDRMEDGSAVRDLTIANSAFSSSDVYVGAVAGLINGGTVERVTVSRDVIIKGSQSIGGIGGMVNTTAAVGDCKVSAALTANGSPARVGGILGYVTGVGETTVSGCTFIGSIDQGESLIAGGIVAQVGNQTALAVTDCVAAPSALTTGGMTSLMVGHFGTSGNTVTDSSGIAIGKAGYLVSSGAAGNVTVTATYGPDSFTGKTLEIADEYELIHFAALTKRLYQNDGSTVITDGANYAGATVCLTADIDLAGRAFPGIGDEASATFFRGSFDGQEHKVSNFTLWSSGSNLGFFRGYAGEKISNLTLENVTLETAGNSADLRASFIVGSHYAAGNAPATISNVHVINGTLHNTAANGASSIGGIVGASMNPLTIENCSVEGSIIVDNATGERSLGSNVWSVGVGGILGRTANGNDRTVRNTSFTGTISAGRSVGGIFGANNGNTLTVENCTVDGTITAADAAVGGVGGYGYKADVKNCTVTGAINAELTGTRNMAGGILGVASHADVSDSTYDGDLTAKGGPAAAGGIVGLVSSGAVNVSRCEVFGTVHGEGNMMGGVVGNVWNCGDTGTTPALNMTDCFCSADVVFLGMSGSAVGYLQSGSTATAANCIILRAHDTKGNAVHSIFAPTNADGTTNSTTNCVIGANYAGGDTDVGDQTYTVTTAQQLYAIARMSKYSNFRSITLELADDIALNDADVNAAVKDGKTDELTPFAMIGRQGAMGSTTGYFRGVFDGKGHTVSGVYVPDSEEMGVGFFAWIDSAECAVKDFTLTNSYFHSSGNSDGLSRAAAVVGDSHTDGGAVVSGVTVGSDVTVVAEGEQAGGIVGGAFGALTVSSCSFGGTLTGTRYVGGILGYHANGTPTLQDCAMGGAVTGTQDVGGIESPATADGSTVTGCTVTGTVTTQTE